MGASGTYSTAKTVKGVKKLVNVERKRFFFIPLEKIKHMFFICNPYFFVFCHELLFAITKIFLTGLKLKILFWCCKI